MYIQGAPQADVHGNLNKYHPIYLTSKKYSKLLVIETMPETHVWFKDQEITLEELVKFLEE